MHAIPTQTVLRWLRKARQHHQGIVPQDPFELRPIIVIATLFFTGARAQEICNLEQNDVVVSHGLVQFHFDSLKHGIPRQVPILNNFLAQLVECYRLSWPASARSPFVFTVKSLHPYPRLIHRTVKAVFPDFSPHSFRHHYASLLASEGVDLTVIQHCLGHRHLNTTAIYLQKLSTSQTSKVWRKIDSQLSQHPLL